MQLRKGQMPAYKGNFACRLATEVRRCGAVPGCALSDFCLPASTCLLELLHALVIHIVSTLFPQQSCVAFGYPSLFT